jgi:hypothetical protein
MTRNGARIAGGSLVPILLLTSALSAGAAENPYEIGRWVWQGHEVVGIRVGPGRPPDVLPPDAPLPRGDRPSAVKTLSNVPAWDWCYGCSPTAAAMIVGYYDNLIFPNMYTGPENGGVCPMDNATAWAAGESPLSFTHNGLDGRGSRGAVDDYWIAFNNTGSDPYLTNGWTEHTWADCTGDYMGTGQSKFGNADGSTTFFNYTNGDPLYDYTGGEPSRKDGCHGLKQFVESRGYSVPSTKAFSQLIYPNSVYTSITRGFTFDNFKSEIDAGRPVMIQLQGHSMVGFGYDDAGQVVYVRDTWDHAAHTMTWGGSYAGMKQYAVTCLQLNLNRAPTKPVIDVTPDFPRDNQDLSVAVTTASTDPEGATVSYRYRWYRGGALQPLLDNLTTVPAAATSLGDVWKCVVTPHDGTDDGPSAEDSVTVQDPALAWVGTTDYTSDGVDPQSGNPDATSFTFEVKFTDPSGAAPKSKRLVVDRRVGTKWLSYKNLGMTQVSGSVATGAVYSCATTLANEVLRYQFRFQASDGTPVTGAPAAWTQGPELNGPPKLYWTGTAGYATDGVSPDSGSASTQFRFRVLYLDSEGEAPTKCVLQLRRNGVLQSPKTMTAWAGGGYRLGKTFEKLLTFASGGTLEYRFEFADADGAATGTPTAWQSGPGLGDGGTALVTGLTAGPTPAGAQVTFRLSGAAQVSATVLNLAGRPIRALCADRPSDAGQGTLLWNARSDAGLRVPSGAYLVRLTARSATGAQSTALATVHLP